MSIVSQILARDIELLRESLTDTTLAKVGLLGNAVAADLDAADNKFISDACSTRESVETVAALGKEGGKLGDTSLSVRGTCTGAKATNGGKYVSPAWARAVSVNKLAATIRRECRL